MIPFILGAITGFLFAVLLMVIYAVAVSSSEMSKNEEGWNEDRGLSSDSKGH